MSYGINSIGSYSGWYNVAQMNDMKLMQALGGSSTSSSKVNPVTSVSSSLNNGAASFLKNYNSKMLDLMEKAGNLRDTAGKSSNSSLSANSSDKDVLESKAKYRVSEPAKYSVNVQQVASKQVNKSQGLKGSDSVTAGGNLTIATNSKTFSLSINPGSYRNNDVMLKDVAKQINSRGAGVTAQVKQENGKSFLELSGTKTGEKNSFVVSGDFATQTGLDSTTQAAADAIYTVDKNDGRGATQFRSEENTVNIGSYKISATLKKTGSADITVGENPEEKASAIQDLVDSYNDAVKFLKENTDRGSGVNRQLKRMTQSPTAKKSMELVGLTFKSDGTLSFDKDVYTKQAEKNPSLTKDIISGSFGFAEGLYNDAKDGMKISSGSLVSNNVKQFQRESLEDPMNMLNMYSKSGAYNMLNYYAVGALLNTMV